jgi:hypothetical protein
MKDFTQRDHQHGQLGDTQLTVMGIGIKCLEIRGLVPFSTRTIGSLFLDNHITLALDIVYCRIK